MGLKAKSRPLFLRLSTTKPAASSEGAGLAAWGKSAAERRGAGSAAERRGAGSAAERRGAGSAAELAEQGVDVLLGVAVEHAGVLFVEERVVDAGVADALAALHDDHRLGLPHLDHGHAGDRA